MQFARENQLTLLRNSRFSCIKRLASPVKSVFAKTYFVEFSGVVVCPATELVCNTREEASLEMKYQREGGDQQTEPCIKWDPWYVKQGWKGRLKILEIIGSFIAAVSLPIDETATRYTFFRIVAWTAFLFAFIDLVLHLSSLWQRVHPVLKAPEALMSFAALTGFLFLIASGLLADLTPRSQHVDANTLALVSGFFAAAFYGVETLLHFLVFRTSEPAFPPTSNFSVVM